MRAFFDGVKRLFVATVDIVFSSLSALTYGLGAVGLLYPIVGAVMWGWAGFGWGVLVLCGLLILDEVMALILRAVRHWTRA